MRGIGESEIGDERVGLNKYFEKELYNEKTTEKRVKPKDRVEEGMKLNEYYMQIIQYSWQN